MTTPDDDYVPNGGWRQSDLVPRPDPTKLTTEAVERATVQFRRDISQLRELIENRLDTNNDSLDQRAKSFQLQIDQRFTAAQKAVDTALLSAEKAVTKAETAAEKRFDSVNEFRAALSDQTRLYMPRTEYEAAHKSLEDRMSVTVERLAALELRLTSRLDRGEGLDAGHAGARQESRLSQNAVVSVIVMCIIAVGVVVSIITLVHK